MSKSTELLEMGAYASGRVDRREALDIFSSIEEDFQESGVRRYALAGSYRRGKRDIGDLDIILASANMKEIYEKVSKSLNVTKVGRSGSKMMTLVIEHNDKEVQLEFINVDPNSFGAALLHSTGSQMVNIGLRSRAKKMGYKLNQYGLFDLESNSKVGGKTEKSIFNALGMKTVPPTRRDIEDWKDWNNLVKQFQK